MNRSASRSLLAVSLLAAGAVTGLTTAAPAIAAGPGHAHLVVKGNFPDPGFAKFGSTYHLYRTGGLFGQTSSTKPASGYGAVHASMTKVPAWVNGANSLLWAPDVFAAHDAKGAVRYVMYFTGESKAYNVHCIGVATSASPSKGFVPAAKPVLCSPYRSQGYEAIDPSAYRAKDGKRYLLYKSDKGNVTGFQIRAVQMNSVTGTTKVGKDFVRISSSTRMEAPSAIAHGGKVWLFTSRGDYANCTYSTDVWSASTFAGGTFKRVRTVISSSKASGLCGPGGATVIQDGATTRIAFHAYADHNHNGVKDSNTRQTWVGELRWNASGPYLY